MQGQEYIDRSIWVFVRLWVDAARLCPSPHPFHDAVQHITKNVFGEFHDYLRDDTVERYYAVLDTVRAKVWAALIEAQYPGYERWV